MLKQLAVAGQLRTTALRRGNDFDRGLAARVGPPQTPFMLRASRKNAQALARGQAPDAAFWRVLSTKVAFLHTSLTARTPKTAKLATYPNAGLLRTAINHVGEVSELAGFSRAIDGVLAMFEGAAA